MGLFDSIKMMADIVKAGVDSFKATGQLDKLTERSRTECANLRPEQERLYQAYKALCDARDKEQDTQKLGDLGAQIEEAEVKYLTALESDASIDKAFRAEITLALQEYARTNGDAAFDGIMEKYMMNQAKTPEEKEVVQLMMQGAKVSGKLDKLTERSQDEFKSLVKPEQATLYEAYKALSDTRDKEKNTDKKNAMTPGVEAAQEKYLSAIAADAAFPQDFRDEITSTLAEYKKIDAEIMARNG